jgi:hypothetical protein
MLVINLMIWIKDMECHRKYQVTTVQKPIELRDKLNSAKDRRGAGEKSEDENRKTKCFRCQEVGHH